MIRKVFTAFALLMTFCSVLGQDKKKQWVDSVFQTLNTRDKIGQLFVVPISAYYKDSEIEELEDQIKDHNPGGILVTKGGPVGTFNLIDRLQKISKVPLLATIDGELGPGKTLDSLIRFPNPLSLGAITSDTLLYSLGAEIARQMKVLGTHINLAPNADIDILTDSAFSYFGSNKYNLTRKSLSLMHGMQDHGVIAFAKHAALSYNPEMEVDDEDLHIDFVSNRLDTSNFYPYHQLIKQGIGGMLTSNFHFSTTDKKGAIPASVSKIFISDILKKKFGFNGLTMTDIPYFHSVARKSKVESTKLAFEVGNDLLLNPYNLNAAIKKIESSLRRNVGLKLKLEISVKKILGAKYDVGLSHIAEANSDNLIDRINSAEAAILKYKLAESSITITGTQPNLIPMKSLDDKKFASVTIGTGNSLEFESYLKKYSHFDLYNINEASDTTGLGEELNNHDVIIISIYSFNPANRNSLISWINKIDRKNQVIICSFGNPYDLLGLDSPSVLILGYADDTPIPKLLAQVIFGTHQASGMTPLSVNNVFTEGITNPNELVNRLAYGIPEQVGINSHILKKIDNIVAQAIDSGATPGCNIIIAKNGLVVYNKAFGWKTYDKIDPVNQETIYDLASITKVAATLQTVMFMHEKKLIDINKKVSIYLPELKESNKKDITFKDILTHQAGLWPYLPFWLQTMKDSTLLSEYYSRTQNDKYPFQVSKDLFASKSMKDSLWQWIINAKIREKTPRAPFDYTYSDMGFYIMHHVAEKLLNQPMQDFLSQNIYEPLGATTTDFLPLQRFPESQIAPTEVDKKFRASKLVGYVHDQGAAMHGGVAGHAGLFSNANDLAKLGQMWLQKGNYGGVQFFKPETIDFFTTRYYETNRRGLGWDKPTQSDWNGPTSMMASPKTFGHTGFTGTSIWVDPEFDIVFVFLSNRVYPDMLNAKLLSANIRPRVQDVIYQAIFEYCKHEN